MKHVTLRSLLLVYSLQRLSNRHLRLRFLLHLHTAIIQTLFTREYKIMNSNSKYVIRLQR